VTRKIGIAISSEVTVGEITVKPENVAMVSIEGKSPSPSRNKTYNLSDLKHALHCGFVELGGSVSVSA
jgi:hypothetical protein